MIRCCMLAKMVREIGPGENGFRSNFFGMYVPGI